MELTTVYHVNFSTDSREASHPFSSISEAEEFAASLLKKGFKNRFGFVEPVRRLRIDVWEGILHKSGPKAGQSKTGSWKVLRFIL